MWEVKDRVGRNDRLSQGSGERKRGEKEEKKEDSPGPSGPE